ncbi:DUF1993 family protein [Pendulispora albinea]|uniref:DUF1993 domain-containing protein n=1 Tax=Pendulispora albinea TaxID=2741071 RepID=A0ABZ2M4Y7_9BACT
MSTSISSSISIYDASVPALIRMLQNLGHILRKGEAFARRTGIRPESLLERRLQPDMFSLAHQVVIVVSGAKGSAARLAGRLDAKDTSPELQVFNRGDEASFGRRPTSFGELQTLIEEAVVYLKTFSRDAMDAGPESITVAKPGEARVFEARAFLLDYVLPNLYFHISIAYALLRSAGVDLGKGDFEGTPAYRVETV